MKAAFFMKNGGPEVMQYGDVPDPVAGPGQVLVDVHAASVNGADWKVRSGAYRPITKFPYVMGRDFSGVVSALGAGVTDLKVGDPVFGVVEQVDDGCYAEKLAIKAAIVAKKPDSLSHVETAALALIGLTALVSVEDTIKLKKGETILVQGGAGGVASFGIQIAKHIGARVITTASAANHDYESRVGRGRGVRHRRRRRGQSLVRRAAAGRACGVHRRRPDGPCITAQRCFFAAPGRRARSGASRADRRAGQEGRGEVAGDQGVFAQGSRRSPPRERGKAPARKARL
jgi:NADPH:quinone reductase-like Zn-dependent oxidoreductase